MRNLHKAQNCDRGLAETHALLNQQLKDRWIDMRIRNRKWMNIYGTELLPGFLPAIMMTLTHQSMIQYRSDFNDPLDIQFPPYKVKGCLGLVLYHMSCTLPSTSSRNLSRPVYLKTGRHFFYFFIKKTQSLSLGNVNPFMEHFQYVEHKDSNRLTEKTPFPPVISVPQNMIHKHGIFLRDEQMGSGKCG